ncbi:hypothetical protein EV426DRAFT_615153, partial [Tirmania nivea]
MPRNRKANRPRYETPDPGQLPTPKQTPGAGSSAKKGPRKLEESLEQERQKREVKELDETLRERAREHREQGGDTDDEVGIGPWEAKGNPAGYLDSEDEEMLDEWGRRNESEVFCKMGVQDWKTVAIFLLEHVVRLVEGVGLEEASPGTGLSYVQAILGEDGSVVFEGREELSKNIITIIGGREALQSEVDELEDKVGELLQELSRKEEAYPETARELSKIERGYTIAMNAAVEENLDLKKQLVEAQLAKFRAETKWKQWAEREVQGKREEVETGAEDGSKREREQKLEKEIQVRAGKLVAAERKKWQAKGKARSIETMSVVEDEKKKPQVEVAVQTEE